MEGDGVVEKKDKTRAAFRDGAASSTAFKPFDQLKYARQETKKKAAAIQRAVGESFSPGDRVSHDKFGEGVILDIIGSGIIVVLFDSGEKKTLLGTHPMLHRISKKGGEA